MMYIPTIFYRNQLKYFLYIYYIQLILVANSLIDSKNEF
jgi:hypothetical protein